jgi:hypothetical protein
MATKTNDFPIQSFDDTLGENIRSLNSPGRTELTVWSWFRAVRVIAEITFVLALISLPGFVAAQTDGQPVHLAGKQCLPVAEAELNQNRNKDICVATHVYGVVELRDGTRFLDVCPADVPDDQCRFTLVSMNADRDDVGDLRKYRDQNIALRGVVRATHGRMGIVISHVRQFSGGAEKFRPNPRLLRDFNGQSDKMPVRDPNLGGGGKHRSFMNTSEKEELPKR